MDIEIEKDPQAIAATNETNSLASRFGKDYAVVTPNQYEDAGRQLTLVKGQINKLDELRKSMTRPIDESKQRIMDFFRAPVERLKEIELTIKRQMVRYSDEQEEIRRRAQREADDLARRERQRLEERAEKAAAAGKDAKAEQLQTQAQAIAAPVMRSAAPKVEGVSTRESWKFVIENEALIPREYLSVDESKIRRVVAALKGDAKIAGVRIYSEKLIAAGAR